MSYLEEWATVNEVAPENRREKKDIPLASGGNRFVGKETAIVLSRARGDQMSTSETGRNEDIKRNDNAKKTEDILNPISAEDLIQPTEELQKTSAKREWQIKQLQEKLGVSREIAERMVDEGGSL